MKTTTKRLIVKKSGRKDYMGMAWHKVFIDGNPLIQNDIHVKVKAVNEEHAINMCMEISSIKNHLILTESK